MSEWKEYNLRELVRFSQGVQVPIDKQSINCGDNMGRFVRIVDFTNDNEEPRYIKKQSDKYFVDDKDVVMIRYGSATAGKVVRGISGYIANNMFRVIPNQTILDKEYLYYFLFQPYIYKHLMASQSSSTMPAIKFSDFDNLKIFVPSLDKQREIVHILNLFNNKIQLNTQTNQTLEQIAQAIYKSWFVDYEPTRAKAAVLAAGGSMADAENAAMTAISGKSAAELAALKQNQPARYQQLATLAQAFPAALTPTEDFGEIPEGWEIKYLKDVCKIVYGKGLPKTKLTPAGYSVFGANGVIGYYSDFMYKEPQVLVGCRGTVGQVNISFPYSFVTNNSLVIEYEKSPLSLYFVEQYLRTLNLKEVSSGSVQPQITLQNMSGVKILVPTTDIHEHFVRAVQNIYEKRFSNHEQNTCLEKTRDSLLPKLLSGEQT